MNKKEFTVEDVLYMYDTVEKWNTYCGNLTSDESLIPMYHSLSEAEFYGKGEFLEGYESDDLVMQLDGLGDLSYTVFEWDMLDYAEGELPTLQEVFGKSTNYDKATHITQLRDALGAGFSYGAAYNLMKLLILYSDVADIRGMFNAITVSNYSKVPLVSEVVEENHTLDDEVKLIEGEGRYAQVGYKLLDSDEGQRVIFTAMEDLQDGVVFSKPKVIKSKAFKEPVDLSQFIY